ncbi:ADP/ATP carrier family protein, partial [Chlamydia psittaci 06-1683]
KKKSSQEKKLLFLQKRKDPHQFREHLLLRTLLHKIQ